MTTTVDYTWAETGGADECSCCECQRELGNGLARPTLDTYPGDGFWTNVTAFDEEAGTVTFTVGLTVSPYYLSEDLVLPCGWIETDTLESGLATLEFVEYFLSAGNVYQIFESEEITITGGNLSTAPPNTLCADQFNPNRPTVLT